MINRTVILFLTLQMVLFVGCGLLSSDHDFGTSVPIDEMNGDYLTDSMVVSKILLDNTIPIEEFHNVVVKSKTGRIIQLNLQNRNIEIITDSISLLYSLQKVNLDSNRISKLPAGIAKCNYLRVISIMNNVLQELPEDLGKSLSIQELNFGHNSIVRLPTSFTQLKTLSILKIGYNRLEELPLDFGVLKKLDYLDLKNNFLRRIPDSAEMIGQIGYLHTQTTMDGECSQFFPHLYVDSNYIHDVSPSIKKWLSAHDPDWEKKQKNR